MLKLFSIPALLLLSFLFFPADSWGYYCNHYSKESKPDFTTMTSTSLYSEISQMYNDGLFLEQELLNDNIVPPKRVPYYPDNLLRLRKRQLVKFAQQLWELDSLYCGLSNSAGQEKSGSGRKSKYQPILSLAGFLRGETGLDSRVETGIGYGGRIELSLATIIGIGDYFDFFADGYVPKIRLKSSQSKLTSFLYSGGIALKPPRFHTGPVSMGLSVGFGMFGCEITPNELENTKRNVSGFLFSIEGNIVYFNNLPMGLFVSYTMYDPWDELLFANGTLTENIGGAQFGALTFGIRITPWFNKK
jgi:hypothetical protein